MPSLINWKIIAQKHSDDMDIPSCSSRIEESKTSQVKCKSKASLNKSEEKVCQPLLDVKGMILKS